MSSISSAAASGEAILIVDDRPENLVAMERVLEQPGIEIIRASSGREALSHLLRRDFACILLDVQMPELDGFEIAELMQNNQQTRAIPIVFVTAISKEDKYVSRGYESGAVDYLFKPLNPTIVRAKVRVFLELYRQRKQLERARAELEQRNRELQEFTSVAAHDLTSPLAKVTAFVQRLEESLPAEITTGKAAQYLAAIGRSTRQMTDFVEHLLAYARAGSSAPLHDLIDLRVVVEEACDNVRVPLEESRGTVEIGELPTILGSHWSLVQLFQNLIANAIKFCGDEEPRIQITSHQDGSRVSIAVRDNGIGISEQDHRKIFQAFRRINVSDQVHGCGIGLATCQRIVEQHRGKISLQSTLGVGSTFTLTFPCPVPARC